jgi:hypothetical protein
MWIVIRYRISKDSQRNCALLTSDQALKEYVDCLIMIAHKGATIVKDPLTLAHTRNVLQPVVSSQDYDYYAEWMEPIEEVNETFGKPTVPCAEKSKGELTSLHAI